MPVQNAGKVTSKTIAREAGVAQTTVSFVLNGKAKERGISDETARRVLEIAEKLNYSPNRLASSLRRQRSGIVGVLLGSFQHSWAKDVVMGMQNVFDAQNYVPFFTMHYHDVEKEREEIQKLLDHRVEAIISYPNDNPNDNYSLILQQHVPLVLLGDTVQEMPGISYVAWDIESAVRLAMNHLIDTGRRRIAFFGWRIPRPSHRIRYLTYRKTLEKAGLETHKEWELWFSKEIEVDFPVHQQLFMNSENRPDAVLTAGSSLAMHAFHVLKTIGLRVPEDVAVITLNSLEWGRNPFVGLSDVPFPRYEVGRQAAETTLKLIQDPDSGPIQKKIPCEKVSIRNSTVREKEISE